MRSLGLITHVGSISEGEKPQMGLYGRPIVVEVRAQGGQGILEITREAAVDLVREMGIYLQTHPKQ